MSPEGNWLGDFWRAQGDAEPRNNEAFERNHQWAFSEDLQRSRASEVPSDRTLEEHSKYLLDEQNLQHAEQDYELKKGLFKWVLVVVSLQLVSAATLVFHVGLDWLKLSDEVSIAFLTGTTIEVLGLAFIVARHLFPTGKDED